VAVGLLTSRTPVPGESSAELRHVFATGWSRGSCQPDLDLAARHRAGAGVGGAHTEGQAIGLPATTALGVAEAPRSRAARRAVACDAKRP